MSTKGLEWIYYDVRLFLASDKPAHTRRDAANVMLEMECINPAIFLPGTRWTSNS